MPWWKQHQAVPTTTTHHRRSIGTVLSLGHNGKSQRSPQTCLPPPTSSTTRNPAQGATAPISWPPTGERPPSARTSAPTACSCSTLRRIRIPAVVNHNGQYYQWIESIYIAEKKFLISSQDKIDALRKILPEAQSIGVIKDGVDVLSALYIVPEVRTKYRAIVNTGREILEPLVWYKPKPVRYKPVAKVYWRTRRVILVYW